MTQLSPMHVTNLRCEYMQDPLGIDARAPRFSWALVDERRGQATTAYQVLVASTPALLGAGRGDKWDSGRVQTSAQFDVHYQGVPLVSEERCYWQVRVWDYDGLPSAWSEPAWFEMGLLDQADWKSSWYGYPAGYTGRALYYRAFVDLKKPVKRVRAYVAGLGLYEFYVNGRKANDHVLEPAQTHYGKRVLYTTIDMTPLLRPGRNGVGAIVGHGWFGVPRLRAQLHFEYEDGTQQICAMRRDGIDNWGDWTVGPSPITSDSIFDGETYDARLERPGWCVPGEGDSAFDPRQYWLAVPVDGPAGRMVAQAMPPIRVVAHVDPLSVKEIRPGVFVFDMGQNMVGWVHLRVKGERGTAVVIRFSENLGDDGDIDQGNLRSAKCTDTYILKGEGVEEWEPRFTYHGFRYVQMTGFPGTPGLDAIRGCVVHSDVMQRGHFECSNDMINRLQRAVEWTESGNLHGIPTDCPQRDERMGWLNDMTVRAEEAHYNFDVNLLHAKWIADIHDEQDPQNGAIPDTAPYRFGSRPADPVTMCYLIVPWLLYQHYGNPAVIAEHYEGLKAWVDYLRTRTKDDIVQFSYYGDWSPPIAESVHNADGPTPVSAHTPGTLMSTGYYYWGSKLIAQMAGLLGKREDAAAYHTQAERVAAAFNATFWDEQKQVYGSGNQACCAFPLYIGIVPPGRVQRVVQTLARDVEAHDDHLTTGNLCSKYVPEMLSAYGRHDLAWKIATQTSYPSWGFMLANGATTIWERWENSKDTSMHSKNHPMMATFSAWFYRYLAGIRLTPEAVGFDQFLVQPNLCDGLTSASASVETVRGRVESAWQRQGEHVTLHVRVPVNCSARIGIPKPTRASFGIYESGKLIWRAGQAAGQVDGLGAATDEQQWITFSAASGVYEFAARD